MVSTNKAWKLGLACEKYPESALSLNTPLWGNPQLPHLGSIPDVGVWAKFNIKTVGRVIHQGMILSRRKLFEDFNISESNFFNTCNFLTLYKVNLFRVRFI